MAWLNITGIVNCFDCNNHWNFFIFFNDACATEKAEPKNLLLIFLYSIYKSFLCTRFLGICHFTNHGTYTVFRVIIVYWIRCSTVVILKLWPRLKNESKNNYSLKVSMLSIMFFFLLFFAKFIRYLLAFLWSNERSCILLTAHFHRLAVAGNVLSRTFTPLDLFTASCVTILATISVRHVYWWPLHNSTNASTKHLSKSSSKRFTDWWATHATSTAR